jgi:hypothetical protein
MTTVSPNSEATPAEPNAMDSEGAPPAPSAAERLTASRERMREWMLRTDGRQEARRRAAAAKQQGRRPSPMDRLRAHPVLGIFIDAVSSWWANHPLQPAASLAQSVTRDALAPLARRHPLAMVASAFVVGGMLVRFRPWRWMAKPAFFAGLASQVVARFITHMPIDSILHALTSFAQHRQHDGEPPAAASDEANAATAEAVAQHREEMSVP